MRFKAQQTFWRKRKVQLGDAAVGRIGESHVDQGNRIAFHLEAVVASRFPFIEHALDFGCGWGRFSELLAQRCGHLWVADLFRDWVDRAMGFIPNATPVLMSTQKLKIDKASMDAVFDIMTIQSINNDTLAREAMHEIKRVAAPGAKIVSLHVKKERAPTRTAAQRAAHMGLSKWTDIELVDIDRTGEKYSWLVGTRV